MKIKLTALILAFVMCLTLIPVSAADDVVEAAPRETYNIMKALGFVGDEPDLSKDITRGEFAVYVAGLIADISFEDTDEVLFYDVKSGHYAYSAVKILLGMGIISESRDGYFYPDRPIEPDHAAKMLTSVVGYDYLTLSYGGYPVGYRIVSQRQRIITDKDFFNKDTITVQQAVDALFSTLNVEIRKNIANEVVTTAGGSNLLQLRFSIYTDSGTVTDNGVTRLDAPSKYRSGTIEVNGYAYKNAEAYTGKLGRKLEVYYALEDGDRKLLYAYEKRESPMVTIMAEDISGFSGRTYEYEENGSRRTTQLSGDFTVIYNNLALTDGAFFSNDVMVPELGKVTLLDSKDSGAYDVVFVWDYIDFLVGGVNSGKNILFNKFDGTAIDLSDNSTVYDIKYEDGSAGDFIAMSMPKTLLNVAVSFDGAYYEIIICKTQIRGAIDEISDEGIYVDGTFYKLSPYFDRTLQLGGMYDFYLNSFNMISEINVVGQGDYKIAYVSEIDTKVGSFGGVAMNLYTEDNAFLAAQLTDKVVVNDVSMSSDKVPAMLDRKSNGGLERQLIRFILNDEGKISKIKLFTAEENCLPDGMYKHYGLTHVLEGHTPLDPNALVFLVADDKENYMVTEPTFFGQYSSVTQIPMKGYALNPLEPTVVNAVVAYYPGGYLNQDILKSIKEEEHFGSCAMVEKVTSTIVDDQTVAKLYLREGSRRGVIYTKDLDAVKFDPATGTYNKDFPANNTETISAGDVVRFGTNKDGRVPTGNIVVIYDNSREWYNAGGMTTYNYSGSDEHAHVVREAWIYDKVRDWHTFSFIPPTDAADFLQRSIEDEDIMILTMSGASNVIVFDRESETTRIATLNDIVTYLDSPANASYGIVYNYQGNSRRVRFYIYQ